MEKKNAWEKYQGNKKDKVFAFAQDYKTFISTCKTERECVTELIAQAKEAGFKDLKQVIEKGKKIKEGSKLYVQNMGKVLILFVMGKKPLTAGVNFLGAHVDSPRLDIKQNPLYEDSELALLDTHYYGGVKKYQWVTLPLALHGVVVKKDGTVIPITIGEKEEDPVFGITDLLIHLSAEQLEKKAAKVIEGESLDILVGSLPGFPSEKEKEKAKDTVKANVLQLLKEQYNIEEDDFLSAEIEAVPAGAARDFGFDRSMVTGYGHDDRVCAYSSFAAILEAGVCDKTSACILVDKEEIGSVGATGMDSKFFEYAMAELLEATEGFSQIAFNRMMSASNMISSDVSAAYDPLYPAVMEKKNTAYLGKGFVFNKYTGRKGKGMSNDANPEFIALIRKIMDKHEVSFQTAELGKVDAGGGGTIASEMAKYNMQVIDGGVAVLNMHAPWEIISKVDLYEAKRGYVAFLKEA
ncbi:M18 family aminopeptidase [Clostridia bacterium]|nr:M18 family aminopeptidase [Clostridia bacterium]